MEKLQRRLTKHPLGDKTLIKQEIFANLQFAEHLGFSVPSSGRILDIGCGVGDSVAALLELGYDAYGVDVLEFWGRDFDWYWEDREKPQGDYIKRLQAVPLSNYRFPFPDSHFDFAFSGQVFEHVFNYEEVFREIARVLKPGAISIHRFPGPNQLMESHTSVPLPVLCKFQPWLAIWALAGKRSPRQRGFTWREALSTNIETMQYCQYPTKTSLMRRATSAQVRIDFLEADEIKNRNFGRVGHIMGRVPAPTRGVAARFLSVVAQRVMVLYGSQEHRLSR
jgi:SAM-dependent methyltransferase